MDCEKFRDILYEAAETGEELSSSSEAMKHADNCSDCSKALAFENSFKKGVTQLNQLAPSVELRNKILAIPSEKKVSQESFFIELINFFRSFPLATAGISCIAGFLIAGWYFTSGNIVQQKRESQIQISQKSDEDKKVEVVQQPVSHDSLTKKDEIDDGSIPGATKVFALEHDGLYDDESEDKLLFLAMHEGSTVRSESVSSVSASMSFDTPKHNETAVKIMQIIESHSIDVDEGYVDPSIWAMRGIISSDKLIKLQPPKGGTWYVTKADDEILVQLRYPDSD